MIESYPRTCFDQLRVRPESELLLRCSQTQLDHSSLQRIRSLLAADLDWNSLRKSAVSHGVVPLLHRSLGAAGAELVPSEAFDELQARAQMNVRRSLLLTSELMRLLRQFQNHGIDAIPFKGIVLSASAYGDVSLRQCGDLDIAVRQQDVARAAEVILGQGYGWTSEERAASGSHDEVEEPDVAFLGPQYYCFVSQDRRSWIDLQWRVTEDYFAFSLDKEELWRRLEPMEIAGNSIFTFSPTDMLLILCVHGSKHRWEKLKWVCDVAEMIRARGTQIDWEAFRRNASIQRVQRMVRLGLLLAQDLAGAEIPVDLAREVRSDRDARLLARRVCEKMFAPPQKPGKLQRLSFYLRAKDTRGERVRFCLRYATQYLQAIFVPTTVDRQVLSLPPTLSFFYYLFRPVRLIGKHGSLMLSRLMDATR